MYKNMFNMAAKLSFINMTNHTCLNKIHHINQQSISKSSTIINFISFEHQNAITTTSTVWFTKLKLNNISARLIVK